ncbi:MAG: DUF2975 domain-containing protein [Sphingopyxis sp.]|uniref:DUF2975 domain-containing protein n=1 Tax=Sphingopyxis sp. TaxID=1908224 RepID=UPI002ABA13D9|nr:DUF2975 domain-containing protein [Sphingopyxis sp.]MDZ3832579.1 DUF2975 domain-containing protein [Sphingopyxis sp.]
MLLWSRRLIVTLNALNWLALGLLMILLAVIMIRPDLPIDAIAQAKPTLDADKLLKLFRFALLLCVPVAIAAHAIFSRLVAMIDATRAGDTFADGHAQTLRSIGWWLLSIQVVDAAFGWISYQMSLASADLYGWQPSLTAWLAILLLFILARIFEQGAAMRRELEQTV